MGRANKIEKLYLALEVLPRGTEDEYSKIEFKTIATKLEMVGILSMSMRIQDRKVNVYWGKSYRQYNLSIL